MAEKSRGSSTETTGPTQAERRDIEQNIAIANAIEAERAATTEPAKADATKPEPTNLEPTSASGVIPSAPKPSTGEVPAKTTTESVPAKTAEAKPATPKAETAPVAPKPVNTPQPRFNKDTYEETREALKGADLATLQREYADLGPLRDAQAAKQVEGAKPKDMHELEQDERVNGKIMAVEQALAQNYVQKAQRGEKLAPEEMKIVMRNMVNNGRASAMEEAHLKGLGVNGWTDALNKYALDPKKGYGGVQLGDFPQETKGFLDRLPRLGKKILGDVTKTGISTVVGLTIASLLTAPVSWPVVAGGVAGSTIAGMIARKIQHNKLYAAGKNGEAALGDQALADMLERTSHNRELASLAMTKENLSDEELAERFNGIVSNMHSHAKAKALAQAGGNPDVFQKFDKLLRKWDVITDFSRAGGQLLGGGAVAGIEAWQHLAEAKRTGVKMIGDRLIDGPLPGGPIQVIDGQAYGAAGHQVAFGPDGNWHTLINNSDVLAAQQNFGGGLNTSQKLLDQYWHFLNPSGDVSPIKMDMVQGLFTGAEGPVMHSAIHADPSFQILKQAFLPIMTRPAGAAASDAIIGVFGNLFGKKKPNQAALAAIAKMKQAEVRKKPSDIAAEKGASKVEEGTSAEHLKALPARGKGEPLNDLDKDTPKDGNDPVKVDLKASPSKGDPVKSDPKVSGLDDDVDETLGGNGKTEPISISRMDGKKKLSALEDDAARATAIDEAFKDLIGKDSIDTFKLKGKKNERTDKGPEESKLSPDQIRAEARRFLREFADRLDELGEVDRFHRMEELMRRDWDDSSNSDNRILVADETGLDDVRDHLSKTTGETRLLLIVPARVTKDDDSARAFIAENDLTEISEAGNLALLPDHDGVDWYRAADAAAEVGGLHDSVEMIDSDHEFDKPTYAEECEIRIETILERAEALGAEVEDAAHSMVSFMAEDWDYEGEPETLTFFADHHDLDELAERLKSVPEGNARLIIEVPAGSTAAWHVAFMLQSHGIDPMMDVRAVPEAEGIDWNELFEVTAGAYSRQERSETVGGARSTIRRIMRNALEEAAIEVKAEGIKDLEDASSGAERDLEDEAKEAERVTSLRQLAVKMEKRRGNRVYTPRDPEEITDRLRRVSDFRNAALTLDEREAFRRGEMGAYEVIDALRDLADLAATARMEKGSQLEAHNAAPLEFKDGATDADRQAADNEKRADAETMAKAVENYAYIERLARELAEDLEIRANFEAEAELDPSSVVSDALAGARNEAEFRAIASNTLRVSLAGFLDSIESAIDAQPERAAAFAYPTRPTDSVGVTELVSLARRNLRAFERADQSEKAGALEVVIASYETLRDSASETPFIQRAFATDHAEDLERVVRAIRAGRPADSATDTKPAPGDAVPAPDATLDAAALRKDADFAAASAWSDTVNASDEENPDTVRNMLNGRAAGYIEVPDAISADDIDFELIQELVFTPEELEGGKKYDVPSIVNRAELAVVALNTLISKGGSSDTAKAIRDGLAAKVERLRTAIS